MWKVEVMAVVLVALWGEPQSKQLLGELREERINRNEKNWCGM